jgi:hypothetical protein
MAARVMLPGKDDNLDVILLAERDGRLVHDLRCGGGSGARQAWAEWCGQHAPVAVG